MENFINSYKSKAIEVWKIFNLRNKFFRKKISVQDRIVFRYSIWQAVRPKTEKTLPWVLPSFNSVFIFWHWVQVEVGTFVLIIYQIIIRYSARSLIRPKEGLFWRTLPNYKLGRNFGMQCRQRQFHLDSFNMELHFSFQFGT